MAVPLPTKIPGEFFVIEYDKYGERYILHVDDEDGSSYDIGSDVEFIMTRFKMWDVYEVGNRTLDMAREFGVAQGILADGRVIALFDRSLEKPKLKFKGEGDDTSPTFRSLM